MKQQKSLDTLRPYVLSGVLFFYCMGIVTLCSSFWYTHKGADITAFIEIRLFQFLVVSGWFSGCLLLIAAAPKIEWAFKLYWHYKSHRGLLNALLYAFVNTALFYFPSALINNGYWFLQKTGPFLFFFSVCVMVLFLMITRVKGNVFLGIKTCA